MASFLRGCIGVGVAAEQGVVSAQKSSHCQGPDMFVTVDIDQQCHDLGGVILANRFARFRANRKFE